MPNRLARLKLFYDISGAKGLLVHVLGRLSPLPRFSRHATLNDFKIHGVGFATDTWQMLSTLGIEFSAEQRTILENEFKSFSESQQEHLADEDFPHNWNSGESLRFLLFTFVRLMKPEFVIETGTANGYSTAAIAHAFQLNGKGVVHSFDILESSAPLVLPASKKHVNIVKVNESPKSLLRAASSLELDTEKGFYFHDSDHSYFGQHHDYELAKLLGFKYYFSDDVETSLVFCEHSNQHKSAVLFDGRKFIGAMLI
jgi:hypothetical protein